MSRITSYINRKTGIYHLDITRYTLELAYPQFKSEDFVPESKWRKEKQEKFFKATTPVRGVCHCGFSMVMHRQDLKLWECYCGLVGSFKEIK